MRAVPLEQRVQLASPVVTALALRRNLRNGVAIEPRPAAADHRVIPALHGMLDHLPKAIRALSKNHVAAVYLVHTRLLHRPYRVRLYRGRVPVGEYRSCLETGLCPRELDYLERLFEPVLLGGADS